MIKEITKILFFIVPLKGTDNPPGAYLFLPNGPAKPLEIKQSFIVVQGAIMQKVILIFFFFFNNND